MRKAKSMPTESTRFNSDWLEDKDLNGHVIGGWCTAICDHEVYCDICELNIEIKSNGKFQIMQHAARKKHKEKAMSSLPPGSPTNPTVNLKPWQIQPISTPGPMRKAKLRKMTLSEKSAAAEMLWILKIAESGFSYRSVTNICTVFQDMFPDSKIATGMILDPREAIFEIGRGLGPFYHSKLIRNIVKNNMYYSIVYDEPIGAGLKRMDVHIRFWSEKQGRVRDHFLCSHKMFSVSADNIRRKLVETVKLEELEMSRWLMVSTTGAGVPNKIYTDIDSDLTSAGHQGLVRMGSCNAAVVHAAFRKGMDTIQHWEVDDLIDAVFRWFNKYPVRKDDLRDMQEMLELKDLYLLRYAADEWVALVPLIAKLLEHWEQLKRYFIEVVPRSMARLAKTKLYRSIKALLLEPATLPRLLFLKSVSELFEPFLVSMQAEGLLVYNIHDDISTLLIKLLRLFVRPELIKDATPRNLLRIDLERDSNLVKPTQMEVGVMTQLSLKKLKPIEAIAFFGEVKKFLVALANSLRQKTPLDNAILANLQFLNPSFRNEPESMTSVRTVAESLPQVMKAEDIPALEVEWKVYEEDNIEDGKTNYAHIDSYWASVFKREDEAGNTKYPLLAMLVKAVLCLNQGHSIPAPSQGQPQGQGGGTTTALGGEEEMRSAIKTLHSTTVQYGGSESVPITRKAISAFMKANADYKAAELAEKRAAHERVVKEAKERELARPAASKEASILLNEKATLTERIKDGSALVARANEQLGNAVKTKNMAEIMEAQELLDVGHKQITDTYQKMAAVDERMHRLLKPDIKSPIEFT